MRILAVDDDQMVLDILQSPMWLGADHELVCVTSADAALTAIADSATPFEVFLLDIVMPVRDGISLCEDIRAMPAHAATPVIMITASQDVRIMQRAFDAGATDFVNKPLNGLELGARINTASLLNDSIARERAIRAALDQLCRRTAIDYDQTSSGAHAGGTIPFLALKNQLLDLAPGYHALSLFSLRVAPFEISLTDPQYDYVLNHISFLGTTIANALHVESSNIAYTGRGIFLGMTMGRKKESIADLQDAVCAVVSRNWQAVGFTGRPPVLTCRPLSSLGVWTGRAAAQALQDAVGTKSTDPITDADAMLRVLIGA